jgi:glycerophosphoryl diester phosphodiesterase
VSDRYAPVAIAHRYGNDLARLRAAEAAGARMVELDAWYHHGRLEVRHAKTAWPLPVLWDKWYVRRRRQPLELQTVLGALGPDTGVMVDLKGSHPRLPTLLRQALASHIGRREILVSSRYWDHLPSLRDQPNVTLFHSVGTAGQLARVWPRLSHRENDAISIHYALLDGATVARLKDRVRLVATWPINDERRLDDVLRWRVDGVITDELEIVGELARRVAAPAHTAPDH